MSKTIKKISLRSLSACYHLVANRLLDLEHVRCDECLDDADLKSLSSSFKFYESILDELESVINES